MDECYMWKYPSLNQVIERNRNIFLAHRFPLHFSSLLEMVFQQLPIFSHLAVSLVSLGPHIMRSGDGVAKTIHW